MRIKVLFVNYLELTKDPGREAAVDPGLNLGVRDEDSGCGSTAVTGGTGPLARP